MRRFLTTIWTIVSAVCVAQQSATQSLQSVPFNEVTVQDQFWAPRQETNRKISLTHSLDMLEKAGNLKDIELAILGSRTGYIGPVFMDSDLYKAIESISYSLATSPDPKLEKRIDTIITRLATAQMADGYLNTWYQVNEPTRRFTNLRDNHELYCAGHMFEAAVAHFQATGKRTFLNVATKYADLLCKTFGNGIGQRKGYSGHPEVELALVKLSQATGEQKYFNLARFFVESRGQKFFATEHNTPLDQYDGDYWQDNVPITEHESIVGHAVRAGYLMSGATDVAMQTGDPKLTDMLRRVWKNMVYKKLYITGGIGPSGSNEGFTKDYDLPNATAYQETCASVANAMWNWRMCKLFKDGQYADVMETALYNGVLAGYSLDGTKYFYVNPLASEGHHHRSEWFGCACCPPNVARTVAAIGGYAYAKSNNSIVVNLFLNGSVATDIGGSKFRMSVKTNYPNDSKMQFTLSEVPKVFETLALRVPGWVSNEPSIKVNGKKVVAQVSNGFASVQRAWKAGDTVDYSFDMPVRLVAAHPGVEEDRGAHAYARGPIVYCFEEADNGKLSDMIASMNETSNMKWEPQLLGGITTFTVDAWKQEKLSWSKKLYQTVAKRVPIKLKAIPYCVWDNRKPGQMRVWLPESPPVQQEQGLEATAKVSMSFVSGNCHPEGINDGFVPARSNVTTASQTHWWPHKGGQEWIQYTWDKSFTVSNSRVYWFDDTGVGECRIPANWKLQYRENGTWKDVRIQGTSKFAITQDQWVVVSFEKIKTDALRISLNMQPNWSAGIHEWQVFGDE